MPPPDAIATLEAGAKWDILEGKLSLTGAVFDAKTSNSRITQSDGTVAHDGLTMSRSTLALMVRSVKASWKLPSLSSPVASSSDAVQPLAHSEYEYVEET